MTENNNFIKNQVEHKNSIGCYHNEAIFFLSQHRIGYERKVVSSPILSTLTVKELEGLRGQEWLQDLGVQSPIDL